MKEIDKRRFDALLSISEFSIARFDERRNHSWKIALGFWAAIIGSATLIRSSSLSVSPWTLAASGLVVILLHGYWLAKVFEADKKDKLLAFRARDLAVRLADSDLRTPELELEKRTYSQDWSVRFQILTTIFLTAAIMLIVSA